MSLPSTWIEGSARRGLGFLAGAILLLTACGPRDSSRGEGLAVGGEPAARGGMAGLDGGARKRKVRIIRPRQSPRQPVPLTVEADLLDAVTCELRVRIRAPGGGNLILEYALPPEAALGEGRLYQEAMLDSGEVREDRIQVRIPGEGFFLLGAAATVNGLRSEAYVEIGERPVAEVRGLNVRVRKTGQRILRVGEE